MTRQTVLLGVITVCSVILFSGCMSYTTLQSPKTLEPAEVILGAGFSKPLEVDSKGFMYEFNSRVGIVNRFDVGAKFVMGALYFFDGKYQILKEPISVSADLGWSYYSYDGDIGVSHGTTTAWYPMIIAGQEQWYVALKRVYLMTETEIELLGSQEFSGSGWYSTNIVAGVVLGKDIRLIPELNYIIPQGSGKGFFVPAIGLQFVL